LCCFSLAAERYSSVLPCAVAKRVVYVCVTSYSLPSANITRFCYSPLPQATFRASPAEPVRLVWARASEAAGVASTKVCLPSLSPGLSGWLYLRLSRGMPALHLQTVLHYIHRRVAEHGAGACLYKGCCGRRPGQRRRKEKGICHHMFWYPFTLRGRRLAPSSACCAAMPAAAK